MNSRLHSAAPSRFGISEWLLLFGLIGLGVALRFSLQSWSNFSPVAGLAMTAGLLLRNQPLALVVPLSIMGISDWFLGGYDAPVMISVYACMMLPSVLGALAGSWLRRSQLRSALPSAVWGAMTGACLGLLSATIFFLVTNASYWLFMTSGSQSLFDAYVAGLPFFRPMLQADVLFGAVGMGTSAAWLTRTRCANAAQPQQTSSATS